MANTNYFYSLGRRKSSTARVRLAKGKGNIIINGKSVEDYVHNSKYFLNKLNQPFIALDIKNDFDITVVVTGGGSNSQIEAIRLGIAKCLTLLNEDFKQTLKRADLLGRDSRDKERKKFGLKGARKKRQFTKR
jgi:small subunit ribosomal protein S9